MIINWSVKSEGKGTRTIQYPDERIEGTVRTQELTCFYVCVGQGRGLNAAIVVLPLLRQSESTRHL